MNTAIVMGRLVENPTISKKGDVTVARYRLAVDRLPNKDGTHETDYLPITVFNKSAEFAEKYFFKGMRVLVSGAIRTGSYTNKDGRKVYTTEIHAQTQEFADSKNVDNRREPEDLPFN